MHKRNVRVGWDHAKDQNTGERTSNARHYACFELIGTLEQLETADYLHDEIGKFFSRGDVPNGYFAYRGTRPTAVPGSGTSHGFGFWFAEKGEIEEVGTRLLTTHSF